MTGRPYLANPDDEPDRYDSLVTTDSGQLRYAGLRKLRGIWVNLSIWSPICSPNSRVKLRSSSVSR